MAILVFNKNVDVMVTKTGLISPQTNFSTPACVGNVTYDDDRTEARMQLSWNIKVYILFLFKSYSTEILKNVLSFVFVKACK